MLDDMTMQERIRRYVDGELTAGEAAALDREMGGNAALQARVQFELQLKHRVRAALGDDSAGNAPASLRAAIASTLASPQINDASVIGHVADGEFDRHKRREGSPSEDVRRTWFAEPRRANFFAVAACLALVAGAVLFGIFAPQISNVQIRQPQVTPIDISQTAAPFAATEHSRCAGSADVRKRKLEFEDAEEAAAALSDHLKVPVVMPNLSALGYEFIGAGRCSVPVDEASAHALYRLEGATRRRPCISVFFFADRGQFRLPNNGKDVPLETGKPCEAGRNPRCSRKVKVFSDGHVVYVISGCDQEKLEGAVQLLEDALAAAGR